jgi:hypothetical protein
MTASKSWQAQPCRTRTGRGWHKIRDQNFREEDENYAIRLRLDNLPSGDHLYRRAAYEAYFSGLRSLERAGLFPPIWLASPMRRTFSPLTNLKS